MTTATLVINRAHKEIQSRIDSIAMPAINWKAVCFSCCVISLLLLLFYVWQVNILAKNSYLANDYERQMNKLSDENKTLQISFAENNFMEHALEKIKELNFQKISAVKYVQVPGHTTLTKK